MDWFLYDGTSFMKELNLNPNQAELSKVVFSPFMLREELIQYQYNFTHIVKQPI